ncbi:hypothetical protein ACFU96_44210 [Streptomyces sp. NPDC057620]|uniref:hypothetical protein n=1 Tax=Streptomyces sp. NPDC057620 TaxID=3346185 RepID=UPI0036B85E10
MPTTPEMRAHIRQLTDVDALLDVQTDATARLLELDKALRPVIRPGRKGRIDASIRPACLRLLSGTVQQPNRTGTRFDFLLDEEATEQLRQRQVPGNRRFNIPDGMKRYRLPKIPAACIELTDTPADS